MHAIGNPLLIESSRALPKKIGIIGAGTIGPDIGYYLKSEIEDLTLVLVDIVPEALMKAKGRIEGYARKGLKKGKLTEAQAEQVMQNLVTTTEYSDLQGCDWVLEAATESLELKKKIFSQIEEVVSSETPITSNTSSLPAQRLFSHLKHPERTTVTHFFAPAFRNPAVEVVSWAKGDRSLVEWLRWFFCATGKVPMVTADVMCFMLDRIFDNWCNEAAYLLDRTTAAEVDSVAAEFVHAGPFFVLNLANGNPIIVETNTLQMEEGRHYEPANIFRSVDSWNTVPPGQTVETDAETTSRVRDRLLGILFSQSFDILDRQIGSAEDLNLGCQLALGFKAGPLDLMEQTGDEEIERIMVRFVSARGGMPQAVKELPTYRDFRRHVLVDDVGRVKLITLRRPQAMNALDDRVTDEILDVLKTFEGDDAVEGFVIAGYGPRAFSAGADIGRFPEVLGDAGAAAQYARDCSRLLLHIDGMSKPVVAALNGMALGGGLELAMRCHGIVADRQAWLQLPEITLGIAPGIGGMVVPYRRWPDAAGVLHDMIRLARRLKAEEAHQLGIVDSLHDGYGALIQAAVERVGELSGHVAPPAGEPVEIGELPSVDPVGPGRKTLSREVIGIIEQAIRDAAAAETFAAALEVGYLAFAASACTAAAREGVGAFLERRKPDFEQTG